MRPIKLIETDREDFDGPIVEFWRDDSFVGMAYWDGEATVLQIYPNAEGEVQDIDVRELQMLLDTTVRIVDPDAFDDEMDQLRSAVASEPRPGDWDGDEHPATIELLAEFDSQAAFRNEDGEGFFPRSVAMEFISKCEELDLAATEMEGFDFDGSDITPLAELVLDVPTQPMMTWSEFRTFANATCQNALSIWPSRESLVVAFVFTQPDTEEIVA